MCTALSLFDNYHPVGMGTYCLVLISLQSPCRYGYLLPCLCLITITLQVWVCTALSLFDNYHPVGMGTYCLVFIDYNHPVGMGAYCLVFI